MTESPSKLILHATKSTDAYQPYEVAAPLLKRLERDLVRITFVSARHALDRGKTGDLALIKRIGSAAWRVEVAKDGKIFSLAIRSDTGREYEILLGTVDSTPIVTDLLSEVARVHHSLPPQTFAEGAGPNHPKSIPLQPLETRVERLDGSPVLALDFGGTILKIAVDPEELRQRLSDAMAPT